MYNIEVQNMKKMNKNKLMASFTLVINDVIEINNCKLLRNDEVNGFYLFLPDNKYTNAKGINTYYPLVKLSSSLHHKALAVAAEAYKNL